MRRWWKRMGVAGKIGLVLGLAGAGLTVLGLLFGNLATLSAKSLLLGIAIGGGSWGLIAWAIASAAVDATTGDE